MLESLYAVLMNYDLIERRTLKLRMLLDNMVKPESIKELKFLL